MTNTTRPMARSIMYLLRPTRVLPHITGNVCKVVTVLINYSIWDKHATTTGLACLTFCLVAAYLYQQASAKL